MPDYDPIQDGYRLEAEWFDTTPTIYTGIDSFLASMIGLVFAVSGAMVIGGSLRLTRAVGVGPANLQAWLVPAVVTELYAETLDLLPGLRSEVLLGQAAFVNPGDTTILFDDPAGIEILHMLTSNAGWNHQLGITVKTDALEALQLEASESAATGPLLSLVEAGPMVPAAASGGRFSKLLGSPSIIRRRNHFPTRYR